MDESTMAKLSLKEIAVLVVLMAEARSIYNPDLEKLAGFGLDGKERRNLNTLGLVQSVRQGRGFAHELTDRGWGACRHLLTVQRPSRAGSAGGALFTLLAGLSRSLAVRHLSPADFFVPPVTVEDAPQDVDTMVRSVYRRLADRPGDWVGLTDIRSELTTVSREELDAALRRLAVLPGIHIIPIANLKALTQRDRDAAIRLGGELKHAMAIEGS